MTGYKIKYVMIYIDIDIYTFKYGGKTFTLRICKNMMK